jgi:hypothetical protein
LGACETVTEPKEITWRRAAGRGKIRTLSTVGNGTKIKGSACDAGLMRARNLSRAWHFDEDKNPMHASALLAHKESTVPWVDWK